MSSGWTVHLTEAAESDFRRIVLWTLEYFGAPQARVYASAALSELAAGPEQVGVKARDDIAKGLLTLHVARRGRKGRHFVMFRVADRGRQVIEVLRLLHDAMDPGLHVPGSSGNE